MCVYELCFMNYYWKGNLIDVKQHEIGFKFSFHQINSI
jgi:hypothetical protein